MDGVCRLFKELLAFFELLLLLHYIMDNFYQEWTQECSEQLEKKTSYYFFKETKQKADLAAQLTRM